MIEDFFIRVKHIWKLYGFEICVGGAILLIIILAIFHSGKRGTYDKSYSATFNKIPGRRPPQESKGEIECRRVLEKLFKKPFPKARPDFMRNPVTSGPEGDFNLELDCYNPELRLAVEYNGVQHYKYIPFMHGNNRAAFQNQKYRDYVKKDLCQKNGVKLIEVPYTVKIGDIENYIIKNLG